MDADIDIIVYVKYFCLRIYAHTLHLIHIARSIKQDLTYKCLFKLKKGIHSNNITLYISF